jgi:hypothetical protein
MEPILLWRSLGTAAIYPQLESQCCYVVVPEWSDAVCVWRRLACFAVQVRLRGMFQRLSRLLMASLVILLAVVLRSLAVYMRRPVLYLGRLPVRFVHDTSYIRQELEHAGYLYPTVAPQPS